MGDRDYSGDKVKSRVFTHTGRNESNRSVQALVKQVMDNPNTANLRDLIETNRNNKFLYAVVSAYNAAIANANEEVIRLFEQINWKELTQIDAGNGEFSDNETEEDADETDDEDS